MALLAATALLLLPGILILRGPLWLAPPASLAFWLCAWSLSAAGLGRSALLNGAFAFFGGLLLVGVPRLGRARLALAAVAAAAVAVLLLVEPGLPWSWSVAQEAADARLLAWRDGVPRVRVPLDAGPFLWPGGLAPIAADLFLLTERSAAFVLAAAVLHVTVTFVMVAGWPADEAPVNAPRLAGAVLAAAVLTAVDPGWTLALALALAAGRLLVERTGPAAAFGAAVLLGAAAVVQPIVAALAACVLGVRSGKRLRPVVIGAVVVVLPLGLPRAPRWPRGHLQGPGADARRALERLSREAAPLDAVCAPPALAPWVPAVAARRPAGNCPRGLTSFHTVPSNPRAPKP